VLKSKEHIIFDWNGTLINDAFVFVNILNALLEKRNLEKIDLKKYRELFCFPIKDFYKKIGIDVSDKSFERLRVEFIREYNKRKYDASLFLETRSVLKKLSIMGLSLSILSASNQGMLDDLINHYSINKYFDFIFGVDNYIADGKIENGKKLMGEIGCEGNEIILIGDHEILTNSQYLNFVPPHNHDLYHQLKLFHYPHNQFLPLVFFHFQSYHLQCNYQHQR
jgi:phosphoglycolate phosphatase